MDNIKDLLDYKSLDIRENIQLLNNNDINNEDKKKILEDLPKQAQELTDTINAYIEGIDNDPLNTKIDLFKYFIASEDRDLNVSETEKKFISMVIDTMFNMLDNDTMYDDINNMYLEFNKMIATKMQES